MASIPLSCLPIIEGQIFANGTPLPSKYRNNFCLIHVDFLAVPKLGFVARSFNYLLKADMLQGVDALSVKSWTMPFETHVEPGRSILEFD